MRYSDEAADAWSCSALAYVTIWAMLSQLEDLSSSSSFSVTLNFKQICFFNGTKICFKNKTFQNAENFPVNILEPLNLQKYFTRKGITCSCCSLLIHEKPYCHWIQLHGQGKLTIKFISLLVELMTAISLTI